MPRNAVLLPPFLTETEIIDGETTAEELLGIFTLSITERVEEVEDKNRDDNNKYSDEG